MPARARGRDRDRRHRRDERRPRGHHDDDPRRRHDAALGHRIGGRSRVARGANAYFKYVNSRGGVNGRTITYKAVDDGSDPAQAVQATQQLVEQDKVFAIFNSLGTEHNLATRDYLNAAKVPQLFVASGATTFGRDFKQYPWTIGFQPSYRAEGWIYGTYLARTKPGAKVGVLLQNDDFGKDLLAGLRQGIARSKVKVVGDAAVRGHGRGRAARRSRG